MNCTAEAREAEDRRLMPPPPNRPLPEIPGCWREIVLQKQVKRMARRHLLRLPVTSKDLFKKIRRKMKGLLINHLEQLYTIAISKLKPQQVMIHGKLHLYLQKKCRFCDECSSLDNIQTSKSS